MWIAYEFRKSPKQQQSQGAVCPGCASCASASTKTRNEEQWNTTHYARLGIRVHTASREGHHAQPKQMSQLPSGLLAPRSDPLCEKYDENIAKKEVGHIAALVIDNTGIASETPESFCYHDRNTCVWED